MQHQPQNQNSEHKHIVNETFYHEIRYFSGFNRNQSSSSARGISSFLPCVVNQGCYFCNYAFMASHNVSMVSISVETRNLLSAYQKLMVFQIAYLIMLAIVFKCYSIFFKNISLKFKPAKPIYTFINFTMCSGSYKTTA